MTHLHEQKLLDCIRYFCYRCRRLSKARLTKMVYLADWESAVSSGATITGIDWYFNHYGPYVEDVVKAALDDSHFIEAEPTVNMHGSPMVNLKWKNWWKLYRTPRCLSPQEVQILDDVVSLSRRLRWAPFIDHVYSTYPVAVTNQYERLDLVKCAREFKEWEELYPILFPS